MTKALIGAGCFWGVEEYFQKIYGVLMTKVGYSGGHKIDPSYEEVCSGTTEHAEVVSIDFEEQQISYAEIIDHFWKCHDATQLNRQGFDIGTQYRSVIFYFSDKQKNIAVNSKKEYEKKISKPVVTEITKATNFYLAEDYHQCYIKKKV